MIHEYEPPRSYVCRWRYDLPWRQLAPPAAVPRTGPIDRYADACAFVIERRRASPSLTARSIRVPIEYADAMIRRMETDGLVSAADIIGRRQVLADPL